MPRRRGFLEELAHTQREQAKAREAQINAHMKAARAAEQAQAAYEREQQRAKKAALDMEQAQLRAKTQAAKDQIALQQAQIKAMTAQQKELERLKSEARQAEVAAQNEAIDQTIAGLENLLGEMRPVSAFMDWEHLKQKAEIPPFQPGHFAIVPQPPNPDNYRWPNRAAYGPADHTQYMPPPLTGMQKSYPVHQQNMHRLWHKLKPATPRTSYKPKPASKRITVRLKRASELIWKPTQKLKNSEKIRCCRHKHNGNVV